MKTVLTAIVVIVAAVLIFTVTAVSFVVLIDVASPTVSSKHYMLINIASVVLGGLTVREAYNWAIAKNL